MALCSILVVPYHTIDFDSLLSTVDLKFIDEDAKRILLRLKDIIDRLRNNDLTGGGTQFDSLNNIDGSPVDVCLEEFRDAMNSSANLNLILLVPSLIVVGERLRHFHSAGYGIRGHFKKCQYTIRYNFDKISLIGTDK